MAQITPEPLRPQPAFNWVYLVELLICCVLTVFFLFYFNRLFATLVSYAIRTYTWRTYRAYIDIQALQVSLLGGRIFFKDIRYHGHNETILVHGGYITWNYWLRRVRDAPVFSDDHTSEPRISADTPTTTSSSQSRSRSRTVDNAEKGGKQTTKKLPCRLSIKVSGVEAFMYNRTPAYDGIIDAIKRKSSGVAAENGPADQEHGQATASGSYRASTDTRSDQGQHNRLRKPPAREDGGLSRAETDRSTSPNTKKDEIPSFLRLLPIYVDCNKGAIVLGNEHTKSVITAQFERATGEFDASSCGPLDVYQQVFNFKVTHPVVHMKPNPDYKADQLDSAVRLKQEAEQRAAGLDVDEKHPDSEKPRRRKLLIPRLPGFFSKSSDSIHTHPKASGEKKHANFASQWHLPGQEQWKGLTRYLDETQKDNYSEWDPIEYAKTSLIADCPYVNISFYWDLTGPVPCETDNSIYSDAVRGGDINGSTPPEYGMDIEVYGGVINYGPWADRHRAAFQNIFFPGAHVDAVPASPLKPGDARVLSNFKLFLSIEEDTVLRIPIREPSKDWKWKGKATAVAGKDRDGPNKAKGKSKSRRKSIRGKRRDAASSAQNVRPFGWIDIKVSGNSSVNYLMDMVASEQGFHNKLDVDIVSTEISSSVNHGLLSRSGALMLDCDLSNPVSWNSLRNWAFNISCRDLELFLLRDHLFLLTDLVADWGTGPTPNYFTFVPFQYLLKIDFSNFKIYLNTNDSNIINNPTELDENNFIMLYGQRLHGDVVIPLDKFRPKQNEIKFDVRGNDMGLEIRTSSKNTITAFVKTKDVGQLGGLVLSGSHTYMSESSPMNTDRLCLDIRGEKLRIELYGWLIHHFMKLKDNYFGEDLHFKTLEEFQEIPSQGFPADTGTPSEQPDKISSDLDVILSISVDDTVAMLPANLYSADNSLRAEVPFLVVDLRFTNYYMDLLVDFSPIGLSLRTSSTSPGLLTDSTGQTEVFIESIVIFGHRLFGLPPTEPTYVCNWDFEVGKISGECTTDFVDKAAGAARSFAFTFDDDENTLPIAHPLIIHDSTFLRLRTADVHIWFRVAEEVFLISTGPIKLDFNDLAGTTFSQRLSACIPELTLGAVDARSASRHRTQRGDRQSVQTHAFLQATLTLNMLKRKLDFTAEHKLQQVHMQKEDMRTNRAHFMFADRPAFFHQRPRNQDVRPPAMQYPEIPNPIFLFQPSSGSSSSTTSGYSSELDPTRGRQKRTAPFRTASSSSIHSSIRSSRRHRRYSNTASSSKSRTILDDTPPRDTSSDGHYSGLGEEETARRNLPPSSVALSSSLAAPYFPLDLIEPDMSDVPEFPKLSPHSMEDDDEDSLVFNDVSSKQFDESFDHTSLLIGVEPGLRLYCTPAFVRCVSNLVDSLQPRQPEDLLDAFQVSVMTKILDHQKRREGKGSTLEFNVRVPFMHLRFQNEFDAGKDQYDIMLNQLKTAARIKNFPGERAGENSVSLHTTLGSLGISVTERNAHGPNDDVAVQAEIRDLLVWVLKGKETSVNINFKTFETATASQKVEYLASLIHRTTMLGEDLGTDFAKIQEKQQARLRYLAWYLTSVQGRFQDPAFLTKVSYALRAVRDHLRSHDSWKIISRFRYTWRSMSAAERDSILNCYSQQSLQCPENAEEQIVEMWDQWRTWDLAHVKKSLAMRMLFGNPTDQLEASLPASLYVNVRSGGIKLILDPGPSQSEAGLQLLAINVALLPPPEPTGLMVSGTEIPKQSTIVQVNARESYIHVHWEICELIETLIGLFQKESLKHTIDISPRFPIEEKKPAFDRSLHIVYVTEKAELSLNTINVQIFAIGRTLRLSVVQADDRASRQGQTLAVQVHLRQALMLLRSRSRLLLKANFDQPSLNFSHQEHGEGSTVPDEIKVAGASRMIKLRVEENMIGLLEVADSVVRDEVTYFHEQATAIQKASRGEPNSSDKTNKIEKTSQLPNVTLALFMDGYQIDLALLQSLTWSIVGSTGRISVVPALGHNVTLQVDYDLAAHTHRMLSNSTDRSSTVSSLELPPVNGRLSVTNTDRSIRVSATGIVETVTLQAAEVQALIATINKPEIANVVNAIQDDIDILKTHIDEIFPESAHASVVKAPSSSRDIIFDIQMTLSGLNVLANAPGQHPDSPTANLAVRLSSIQLKASNIGPDQEVLPLPEAIVLLHEMSIEMTLSDAESIRRCGNLTFSAMFQATAQRNEGSIRRVFRLKSSGLEVNIFAETASAVVDVMNHLQDKIKDLDLSKEKKYLKRLRHTKSRISSKRAQSLKSEGNADNESVKSGALFTSTYSLELLNIQISWIVGTSIAPFPRTESENLILSFRRVDLSTRKDDAARLMIEDMNLQMVPVSAQKSVRSPNSALLPEVVFNVAYSSAKDARNIAFHAAGKSLDLQLDSRFILPAKVIERSIALAGKKLRTASANWNTTPTTSGAQRKNPFGNKRLASLLVDASFAGAVVHINGSETMPDPGTKGSRAQQKGRYSQFVGDTSKSSMDLRAPGIALKVEYRDEEAHEPSLNAELRVDGSSNTLFPTVVPVIIEISESIKEVVREKDEESPASATVSAKPKEPDSQPKPTVKLLEEDNLITADPSTLLGRTRLNLGLRICKQEFSLSCQPIARVAAIAKVEDIYITVNSVKSQEHGHFFAASATFEKLEAAVQHVYSRDSTFGFNVDSVVLSLMNSKHLSGTSGISAILKINPIALQINARQLQDFLLFREIWVPPEIRRSSKPPTTNISQGPQEYLMQRYQQVTAATAFPWNANVAIADVSVELDLGQAIGKTSLHIHNMWASSKKGTDWEQNLCIGVEKMGLRSTGRTSGFVELAGVKVRTSISWPSQDPGLKQTPLIQASVGFHQLFVKTGFDYQAFVIADIANFDFLMYNVREQQKGSRNRLVAILDGDKVHVFCHATSAAQGLALWQAVERLIQENEQAYKQSLRDIEKFLRRKSSVAQPYGGRSMSTSMVSSKPDNDTVKAPISLHTDVVVTLRSINFGVFPSTFVDTQILLLTAADAQARFAVALEHGKIHSGLGLTLGQLSVALSSVSSPSRKTNPVSDLTVEDVVETVKTAKGGTILRVPKVVATMHTWQQPRSSSIDYVFKSSLEGKVDVGWNYSRISYIRTMWANHSRTLASRLGKPLPESNIKISSNQPGPSTTSSPPGTSLNNKLFTTQSSPSTIAEISPSPSKPPAPGQEKITAVVNVPQSRYTYTALEPPLIETPQLRDMGEATPPLEWIGLHRDRLPNVTHQIVIVTLLEVAREVEDAYGRILGNS